MRLGRLEVTIDVAVAGVRVSLAGRIDDSVRLGDLAPQLSEGAITIDAGGVTFVNSYGMREWIRWMRTLAARGEPPTLERVSDVMMTQMNLIPELRRTVRIASFQAQYACPACGAESTPLIDAVAHAGELAAMRAPRQECAECGGVTELADFPERYLSIFTT